MVSIANAGDDATENEASVDLKGVIRDLHDEISNLNALLQTFGKGLASGNKVTKMGVDEHLRLIKAHGEMVKSNADYKRSLQGTSDSMKLLTNAMKGGLSGMAIFSVVAKKFGGLSNELDNFKAAAQDFADFQKKVGVTDQKSKAFANLNQEDQGSYLDKQAVMEEADKKRGGAFGGKGGASGQMVEMSSKMGKWAEKNMGGIILGAGTATMLLGVLKKAFDVSPMFQQMMKLLNFGIMMVLRPIGDFFGFLFRPILIMLLRKFIIPWYTKMYPVMMKMGDLIGQKLSGAFEALAAGDVAGAFAILFEDVDFKQILTDMTQGIRDWISDTDWDQVKKDIGIALLALGTGIWANVLAPLGSFIYDEVKLWWDNGLTNAYANFGAFYFMIRKWFKDGIAGMATTWTDFWDSVYKWFDDGITNAVVTWTDFFTSIKDWFITGITNAATDWTDFWEMIKDAIWTAVTGLGGGNQPTPSKQSTYSNNQREAHEHDARGGHITERILGVGDSGRRYEFGEAGNETVIPDDQLGGGANITINIQNMSASQQDLNNLRQTILDVIQQSSARRGRA